MGSFLNCLVYRLEVGEGFINSRSYCPHCKHKLGFWDLIPVLSFIGLKGCCRYCKNKISLQYPLVELATGTIFFLIAVYQLSVVSYIITPFLIVIFIYDLKHYIIPDRVIFPAIGIALVYDFLNFYILKKPDFLIPALGAAGFFLTIVLLSRGKWMGVGDIKLAFLMGLLLGWPSILPALFFAFLSGSVLGLGLIIAGAKTMKSQIPFGPFLVAGTILSMFFGPALYGWYLNLFR